MAKFKLENILVAWKGKYLQIERLSGSIVFCIRPGKGGGFYGLHSDQIRHLIVKKALPIYLGIKLQPVTKTE